MPTVIALDMSLSMLRCVQGGQGASYHQMAVQMINEFLDYLTVHAKLEYVSLVSTRTAVQLPHLMFVNNRNSAGGCQKCAASG